MNELIDLFKHINPDYERLFKIKAEREAMQWLIDKYTYEKVERMLTALPGILSKPYSPTITKPTELRRKLGALLQFMKKEGNKNNGKITHLPE